MRTAISLHYQVTVFRNLCALYQKIGFCDRRIGILFQLSQLWGFLRGSRWGQNCSWNFDMMKIKQLNIEWKPIELDSIGSFVVILCEIQFLSGSFEFFPRGIDAHGFYVGSWDISRHWWLKIKKYCFFASQIQFYQNSLIFIYY